MKAFFSQLFGIIVLIPIFFSAYKLISKSDKLIREPPVSLTALLTYDVIYCGLCKPERYTGRNFIRVWRESPF